jgi:hypothetical protein
MSAQYPFPTAQIASGVPLSRQYVYRARFVYLIPMLLLLVAGSLLLLGRAYYLSTHPELRTSFPFLLTLWIVGGLAVVACVGMIARTAFELVNSRRAGIGAQGILLPGGVFSTAEILIPFAEIQSVDGRDWGPFSFVEFRHRGGRMVVSAMMFQTLDEYREFEQAIVGRASATRY